MKIYDAETIEEAQECIKQGQDINQQDPYGLNLLMWSALLGRDSLVKWLIENGADVNAANVAGYTALMYAASENCGEEIIELLLSNGADLHTKNHKVETALECAINHQNIEELKAISIFMEKELSACKKDIEEAMYYASYSEGTCEMCKHHMSSGCGCELFKPEMGQLYCKPEWRGLCSNNSTSVRLGEGDFIG